MNKDMEAIACLNAKGFLSFTEVNPETHVKDYGLYPFITPRTLFAYGKIYPKYLIGFDDIHSIRKTYSEYGSSGIGAWISYNLLNGALPIKEQLTVEFVSAFHSFEDLANG